jgi:hypothetical protein
MVSQGNWRISGPATGYDDMKPWAKEMFETHNAQKRARASLPWPEKLRISARMGENWYRKCRGEPDASPAKDL